MPLFKRIAEGFEVKDLISVLEPKLHIDEFKSKMGTDDKNIVISFLVNDKDAANDLVDFLERGFEWVIDADVSSSTIQFGSYLVFAEILRRSRAVPQIFKILTDLKAACGVAPEDWKFRYMKGAYHPLTAPNLRSEVPLSPKAYRQKFEKKPMDEMRLAAGILILTEEPTLEEIRAVQFAAGLR